MPTKQYAHPHVLSVERRPSKHHYAHCGPCHWDGPDRAKARDCYQDFAQHVKAAEEAKRETETITANDVGTLEP